MAHQTSAPPLSVSLVTYRIDPAVFLQVLESLERAVAKFYKLENKTVTVRIIDNGGQKAVLSELIEQFQSEYARYELIADLNNIGYGRAHNLAEAAGKAGVARLIYISSSKVDTEDPPNSWI